MTVIATWCVLGGLVSMVVAVVAAHWLATRPDDELARLLDLDLKRAKARAAMSKPHHWSAR